MRQSNSNEGAARENTRSWKKIWKS